MLKVDQVEPIVLRRSARTGLQPILRWAGGKRWLAATMAPIIEASSPQRLVEPFLGGAAIFLALDSKVRGCLSDSNRDLIGTYSTLTQHHDRIAESLTTMPNDADTYYAVRERFHASDRSSDAVQRAIDFIYLNHHSFNGIYRVNRDGKYNVPFGFRKATAVPEKEHLKRAADRFADAELRHGDFQPLIDDAGSSDFVFADPPYTVAHNSNGFVKYNQKLFTFDDQKRLAISALAATERGAKVVVTNANHESIRALYSSFNIYPVRTKSTIGGSKASRAASSELIITNLDLGAVQ